MSELSVAVVILLQLCVLLKLYNHGWSNNCSQVNNFLLLDVTTKLWLFCNRNKALAYALLLEEDKLPDTSVSINRYPTTRYSYATC